MAEKIACGYFLLLRNKKTTDLDGPFLAAVRQPKRMAEKIAAKPLFFKRDETPGIKAPPPKPGPDKSGG